MCSGPYFGKPGYSTRAAALICRHVCAMAYIASIQTEECQDKTYAKLSKTREYACQGSFSRCLSVSIFSV